VTDHTKLRAAAEAAIEAEKVTPAGNTYFHEKYRFIEAADPTTILALLDELRDAKQFIESKGYRRCDIPSCNCGSWHGGQG